MARRAPPSLIEDLQEQVARYLEDYPRVGIMGLARRSGVSHTAIRRLLSGDLKELPSPNTVLNLLGAIHHETDIKKLISRVSGEIGDFLKRAFPQYRDIAEGHRYRPDLERHLGDRESFLVFLLASTRAGSHRTEIRRLFGAVGEEKLEKLLSSDLLVETDEGKIVASGGDSFLSIELARQQAGSLLGFFKPAFMAQGANIFYALVESVNETGRGEIIKIHSEAVRKVQAIVQNEKYHGEIPVFSLSVSDSLTWPELNASPEKNRHTTRDLEPEEEA